VFVRRWLASGRRRSPWPSGRGSSSTPCDRSSPPGHGYRPRPHRHDLRL